MTASCEKTERNIHSGCSITRSQSKEVSLAVSIACLLTVVCPERDYPAQAFAFGLHVGARVRVTPELKTEKVTNLPLSILLASVDAQRVPVRA